MRRHCRYGGEVWPPPERVNDPQIPRTRQYFDHAGNQLSAIYEAWLRTDLDGKVRVLLTGPQNFERFVIFSQDEESTSITEMVRARLDE